MELIKNIKYYFKRLWYSLIGKKYYRFGWKLLPLTSVIINDEFICEVTIKS